MNSRRVDALREDDDHQKERIAWKKFMLVCYLIGMWMQVVAQKIPDSTLIRILMIADTVNTRELDALRKEVSALRYQLQLQQNFRTDQFSSCASFLDAALNSTNNLQALVLKESYRNKIASLNNPAANELGFSLETEIQNALKPLLQKTKKTDAGKLSRVVQGFLETGKNSPASLFPAANIFTGILAVVGNLTVSEKSISQDDLDMFTKTVKKYFSQYERLYRSNLQFNQEMEQIKLRLGLLQDDIRLFIQDVILSFDKTTNRQALRTFSSEELMLRYLNPKKITDLLKGLNLHASFPQHGTKSCKEIASNIQRIYNDYALIYNNNFKEIKSIISDTRNISPVVDQVQLTRTLKELEALYNESKTMDADNLRLKTLFDRLDLVSN